ncbi:hypothetical protein NHX12_018232 [Muraenolepis orangiensis]|uniref:Uncharacterized protein n=1 Tax=Muraenolepis orangiensis TaxID=630683 RepID=A0A9Q0EW68_9TELE|nr:hypothetical protein NHX12_018232 [Muraenolepis orangiensis]
MTTVHGIQERLDHGRLLKIYLPKSTEKLEFMPVDRPGDTMLYWENNGHRSVVLCSTGEEQTQGTYIQKDYWNKEISSVKGIAMLDASLSFFGNHANVTLVHDGTLVSQNLPDYWDRVILKHGSIEIRDVNTSDVGRYILTDRRDRVVSITRMELTGTTATFTKKIFKQKASTASTIQATPERQQPPPGGPAGPPPSYHPGGPGAPGGPTVFYHGPNAGINPAYPPQYPMYPPSGPGYMPPPSGPGYMPPAQPPQWNAPVQPGAYPPGPPIVRPASTQEVL